MKYLFLAILAMSFSCNSRNVKQNVNRVDDTDIEKYTLTENDFENVKNFLNDNFKIQSKDTIIIKYEFNKENCWDRLDAEGNTKIQYFIDLRQKEIQKFNLKHQNSIALHFKEEGDSFNKIISLDKSIYIDKGVWLKKIIFREKNECGNTIILLQNGTYYLRRSDPHFDIIQVMNKSEKHD